MIFEIKKRADDGNIIGFFVFFAVLVGIMKVF